jgi:hypothetical protein
VIAIVSILVGFGSFVCLILVLTKMYPEEGALKTILGLICGLYALIWGWQNADRLNIKPLMQIWTGLVILSVILNVLVRTGG